MATQHWTRSVIEPPTTHVDPTTNLPTNLPHHPGKVVARTFVGRAAVFQDGVSQLAMDRFWVEHPVKPARKGGQRRRTGGVVRTALPEHAADALRCRLDMRVLQSVDKGANYATKDGVYATRKTRDGARGFLVSDVVNNKSNVWVPGGIDAVRAVFHCR
jgi:hypothetical protein